MVRMRHGSIASTRSAVQVCAGDELCDHRLRAATRGCAATELGRGRGAPGEPPVSMILFRPGQSIVLALVQTRNFWHTMPISHIMSSQLLRFHQMNQTYPAAPRPASYTLVALSMDSRPPISFDLAAPHDVRAPSPHLTNMHESNMEGYSKPRCLRCCPTVFTYRARPRNAIIARSTSTTCSAVSRPTRAWTFDLLTVVSLSIITSLSWSSPESRPLPPVMRMRISGASNSVLVIGATVTELVASKRSS